MNDSETYQLPPLGTSTYMALCRKCLRCVPTGTECPCDHIDALKAWLEKADPMMRRELQQTLFGTDPKKNR